MDRIKRDKYGLSESFKQRIDQGAFWESWVGCQLARKGLYVVHNPVQTAEEQKKHAYMYAHTFDMSVAVDWPDVPATYWATLPVEVKSTGRQIADPVFVCSLASWKRKWGVSKSFTQRDQLIVTTFDGYIMWLPKGSPVSTGTKQDGNETFACVYTERHCLRHVDDFVKDVHVRLG